MTRQPEPVEAGSPVEIYEQVFVPAIFRPWAGELLRRVAPRPGERVVDVACGTGAVTREVAPLVGAEGTVVGLDLNPGMLAVARSLPRPDGAAIEWREGSADALPFADGSFDLVLCQQGLQFFPDRPGALREMARVLVPGGRVGITVWRTREHQSLWAAFDDVSDRHFGPSGDVMYSMGDAGELRGLLEGAGFAAVAIEPVVRTVRFPSVDRFVRLTVLGAAAVLPEFERMGEAERDGLVATVRRELDGTLQEYVEGDTVVFPLATHIAVGRV